MLGSLQENPKATSYDGRDDDERIKYVIRKSALLTIPWLAATAILFVLPLLVPFVFSFLPEGSPVLLDAGSVLIVTVLWYLFSFGFFLQNACGWFFNILIITNKKIVDIDFTGFLYKNISETTLNNIEDVTSNVSGAFGVAFNIGSLFIQTAAEKREFEFHGVEDPSRIRDVLSDLVAKVKHYGNNA
ncbi:hypothetical protein A2380_02600 [candidate division WWE3 bacterium RIFOXYB1_FULL_43_24]|uniref:DUF304 domain-containing protein n=2 Tax=Katanobacteria TaxID=422282 RepID=A0A0G1AWG3_UNCKA|nr:MAG: hypothetical protein UU92_C0007G0089 [candidate division WWE3 bacterium GW2011_GWA1_42_12]KKS34608.1 MAG: hypothetical protein UU97_C0008G0010 [candidate division WWE3 bacterium GW2011_GWD1_42_14]KKS38441.1 MAG: hypothetical protein UV00_C0007G0022 [candidate division WWE3 bacterium GW2011_GWF1_42_14]KKS40485.1 MAG: hypothetical protein UV03_C0006G0017 [candidate division WWE3 bacterium GW2011_GWE1_42_16]KKS66529.1 MAG: hypothetical protein UV35_C0012G0005 [candidate division WWE3 bacte